MCHTCVNGDSQTMHNNLFCFFFLGFLSFRDEEMGSPYIRTLCKIFQENAHKEDVLDMITMVSRVTHHILGYYATYQACCTKHKSICDEYCIVHVLKGGTVELASLPKLFKKKILNLRKSKPRSLP